jgi:histone demethylase JARID1
MKRAAPELFENAPDLLHQLVTIMNPNILMAAGVPIYRCMQRAGEFVITFPRAYHAGFNQGYNFAEAVNFCPPDWLPKGRECVRHYSTAKRFCVFSQDELVCKIAGEARGLPLNVATAAIEDMTRMRQAEVFYRKAVYGEGIRRSAREYFEMSPDDARQCDVCKTTLFLSAVCCRCDPSKLACLRHFKDLCQCYPEKKMLKYRYTLDELKGLISNLRDRSVPFKEWLKDAGDLFGRMRPGCENKPSKFYNYTD